MPRKKRRASASRSGVKLGFRGTTGPVILTASTSKLFLGAGVTAVLSAFPTLSGLSGRAIIFAAAAVFTGTDNRFGAGPVEVEEVGMTGFDFLGPVGVFLDGGSGWDGGGRDVDRDRLRTGEDGGGWVDVEVEGF